MLRLAMILLVLVTISVIGASGCTGDPQSGPPDYKGTILDTHYFDKPAILMSIESGTGRVTDKIVIHINDVIDIEKLEVDQAISVWTGEDKFIMKSNPPQVVAQKIEIQ